MAVYKLVCVVCGRESLSAYFEGVCVVCGSRTVEKKDDKREEIRKEISETIFQFALATGKGEFLSSWVVTDKILTYLDSQDLRFVPDDNKHLYERLVK